MRVKFVFVILVIALVSIAAFAQDAPPAPELPGEIIADGFTGPQGIFVDADGNVWVVDSGVGGDEEVQYASTETGELIPAAFGVTARLAMISPDGTVQDAAALPSVFVGTEPIGGADVVVTDESIFVTIGHWTAANGEDVIPGFDTVSTLVEGELVTVADFWAYERDNNPDGTSLLDSHPYGMTMNADGHLLVADAGANVLAHVNTETGEITTLAVFDPLPGVFPSPFRDGELLTDPVPTGVAVDADGNIFVSLLTGAPFIPGTASIQQVDEETGEVTEFVGGLTMLTDLAIGPDGNLYATSFAIFGEQGPTLNSGSVVRIVDGAAQVVLDGLPFPTGIDFNADGDGFIVINGVGAPGSGAVLAVAGLTEAEGMAMDMMGDDMGEEMDESMDDSEDMGEGEEMEESDDGESDSDG